MKMRSIALLAGLLLSAPALAAPRFGFLDDQANDANWKAHQSAQAAGGANMIRLGVDSFAVISNCTSSGITWNNAGWAPFDAEINNAISLGFKISLGLADTNGCAVSFNPTDFNNFTANYVGTIAARYAGKVDTIQLYNEANTNSYQDYSIVLDPSNYPRGYLANEAAALLAAHTAMKAADPNMRLTTNSDDSNATMAEVYVYFDALAPSLDIISEDNYPGYNGAGAANYAVMGQRITDAYNRYGKPVAIEEFGDSTTGITATQQGQEIVGSIQAMQGVAGLTFALIYEYLDHSDLCCFGIVDVNNAQKSDYTAVMNAIAAAAASGPPVENRFPNYVTGYDWWSNSPPGNGTYTGGHAGGDGTYGNPITMAVGYVGSTLDYPDGTIFYIPNLRRYFIVADECAACHADGHFDVWVDAQVAGSVAGSACANAITGTWLVIENPANNYAVDQGIISSPSGCTSQFGNTVVTAGANTITGVHLSPTSFTCGTAGTVGAISLSGTGNYASSTLSLTGADASQFTLSSSTLPSNLQVGASPAGCPTSYLLNIVATDAGATGSPFTQSEIITAHGAGFNESCSLVQSVNTSTNAITVTSATCTP